MASSSPSSSRWSDLLPDLLGRVIAHLTFPGDRARLRAVCRAWRSAARHHMPRRQFPWIVLPDGSFCTDGAFFPRVPGLPENVTCLGAGGDGWLALDRTDDVFRRTNLWDKLVDMCFLRPRPDVKHRHTYLLYNPFSGETVALPELDSVVGYIPETFEIRKVLMRSSTSPADDLLEVQLMSSCAGLHAGKGSCVLADLRVFDVAFHGDRLYGITPEEELVAIDLAEDDEGMPTVPRIRRVIRRPLADGEEDRWSFVYDDDDEQQRDDEDEAEEHDYLSAGSSNEEAEQEWDDNDVPDGVESEHLDEPSKAYMTTSRQLVVQSSSCAGGDDDEHQQLLMVRHHDQSPAFSRPYTRGVDIFKADMKQGKWVPVSTLT
ncbi:hypothetical protein HU200_052327 [Digitaria exilis]|uniref:F-box domain-containing protein n=1 Tax=Digitaria exilis TaxID=1010633 RepID=A0A835E8Q4_9POAL|nr:hypothetical protein HU200_052327 [Digitaria exilis]